MSQRIKNRTTAGQELAIALQAYQDKNNVIVLGLPRGGLPLAYEIANHLHAPLDLMLVRKLGTPYNPELAMGAIASGNIQVLNQSIIDSYAITSAQIDRVVQQEQQELNRRQQAYRGQRPYPDLHHKIVILVDDGLATGATMHAAIDAVRLQKPQKIVVAVPVAPPDTIAALSTKVDEIICPLQPYQLSSIGQWYEDFSQVEDNEVTAILNQAWSND